MSYDDSVDVSKPKVFSAELTQRYYQEWIVIPGSDKMTKTSKFEKKLFDTSEISVIYPFKMLIVSYVTVEGFTLN